MPCGHGRDGGGTARDGCRSGMQDEAGLREALEAGSVATRRAAAIDLVEAAEDGLADATVAALVERVRADDDPDVRQFAVEALGAAGRGGDAVTAALEDPDPWVRAEAVVAHSRARPGDLEPVRDALEDDSGWVRRNAVIALGKAGAVDGSTLIERLKSDPHPPVREYAAQYLADVADAVPEAVRILAAVLAREPNAFVRAKAAESLGDLGTDRAEQALQRQGLHDRSDAVQRTARRALAAARGTDPEAIEVPDPAAPGGGPDRPGDRSVGGREGWTPERTGARPRGPDAGTHEGPRPRDCGSDGGGDRP